MQVMGDDVCQRGGEEPCSEPSQSWEALPTFSMVGTQTSSPFGMSEDAVRALESQLMAAADDSTQGFVALLQAVDKKQDQFCRRLEAMENLLAEARTNMAQQVEVQRKLENEVKARDALLTDCHNELVASEVARMQAENHGAVVQERLAAALARLSDADLERQSLDLSLILCQAEHEACKSSLEEHLARNTCCVCMHAARTTVLQPCSHFALCSNCAEQLRACPLCRHRIRRVVHVISS